MSKKDRRSREARAKEGGAQAARVASMVEIAGELDAELRRFEELAAAARRTPLSSLKSIERAAGVIREAADSQKRLTDHLHGLLGAMASARDRVEASARALNARGEEIGQRSDEHAELLQRLAALGQETLEIGAIAQTIGTRRQPQGTAGADPPPASGTPEREPDVLAEIRTMLERMGTLVQKADELAAATDSAGFVDLARQADSLRQTLGTARHKVAALERSLLANGPPRA